MDELDFARRLLSWNKIGFPEIGDTTGRNIQGIFGKVFHL